MATNAPVAPRSLFAVIAAGTPEALGARIQQAFPDGMSFSVADDQWLIAAPSTATTKEISTQLQITTENPVSTAIVLACTSYFGRANVATWEWIVAKTGTLPSAV
jgi:hypothetical protein